MKFTWSGLPAAGHFRKLDFLKTRAAYDIIGDLHGNAHTAISMLRKLGYREQAGVFRHAENTAVFVGDIINRGPRIRETVHLVRAMCEGGSAMMVLGNHELDALRVYTAEGKLRPNLTEKQLRRTEATRIQVAEPSPEEWAGCLTWFRTLPLYLEFEGFRVVHACWDAEAIQTLCGGRSLPVSAIADTGPVKAPRTLATEAFTQGPEFPVELPGRPPEKARAKWWCDPSTVNLRTGVLPKSSQLPDYPPLPLTAAQRRVFRPYGEDQCPVFFGHYSWNGHPLPYLPNVACLDRGIARGGPLCAYRWRGEKTLLPRHFVTVPSIG